MNTTARRILLLTFVVGAALQAASAKTIWDGIYSQAQADRGKAVYEEACARCHGGDLLRIRAAPLKGPDFLELWREDTLDGLHSFVLDRMPKGGEQPKEGEGPDSISAEAKLDALVYVLSQNGLPAGSADLTPAGMEDILVVGKDGPAPLANSTSVVAVGCLAAAPPAKGSISASNTWELKNVAEPTRARAVDRTTPEELKRSAARPAGELTFTLRNIEEFHGDFDPTPFAGKRAQVKGIVLRQDTGNRISVTHFESLGTSCTP